MKKGDFSMEIEKAEELKKCIMKISDFAHAIWLDEATSTSGGISVTMTEEIESYCEKAVKILATVRVSHTA